jgi:hypothetical protein
MSVWGGKAEKVLRVAEGKTKLTLCIARGTRCKSKLTIQLMDSRRTPLLRLETGQGVSAHKNPEAGPEIPYQGKTIIGSHIHVYREGFRDQFAYALADYPAFEFSESPETAAMLEQFCRFCCIQGPPPIQLVLL